ncbi:MAG: substrate-binding domain-containing protein, partial [Burkholderiales bacterium]
PMEPPISQGDLGNQCWIVRESGSGTAQATEDFLQQQGIHPQRRVVVGSNTAAVQMALSGAGVCLVPRTMVQSHITRRSLQEVSLPAGPLTRPLNWVSLRGRPASLARQAFEALLKAGAMKQNISLGDFNKNNVREKS